MTNCESVLKTLDIIIFEKKNFGYHGMMLFLVEIMENGVFLQNINQFRGFRDTPNDTQMVPKILS